MNLIVISKNYFRLRITKLQNYKKILEMFLRLFLISTEISFLFSVTIVFIEHL